MSEGNGLDSCKKPEGTRRNVQMPRVKRDLQQEGTSAHPSSLPLMMSMQGSVRQALKQALGSRFRVRLLPVIQTTWTFFDTFDWRLWDHDRLLYKRGETLFFTTRYDRWIGRAIESTKAAGLRIKWAHELAAATLAAQLGKIVGERALMPYSQLALCEESFEVVDTRSKVVARLRVVTREQTASGTKSGSYLTGGILDGYQGQADCIVEVLLKSGWVLSDGSPLVEELIERKAPRWPWDKTEFAIPQREMGMRNAVRMVGAMFLKELRLLEEGIITDCDVEFLHDYRVILRRLRSVLSLFHDAYPEETAREIRRRCGAISRATNRLRDLDVWLKALPPLRDELPACLQEGFDLFAGELRQMRQDEHVVVAHFLVSLGYRKEVGHLARLFSGVDHEPATERSEAPFGLEAMRRIRARAHKSQKLMDRVCRDPGVDTQVHELRIQLKRVRYLLDLCQAQYPEEGCRRLLRRLRKVQNLLGTYNDLAVQERWLAELPNDCLLSGRTLPDRALLACGGVIVGLTRRRRACAEKLPVDLKNLKHGRFLAFIEAVISKPDLVSGGVAG